MSNAVAVPVLLPLLTALAALGLRDRRFERGVVLGSAAAQLAVAVWLAVRAGRGEILVLPLGGWDALVGIVWAVDRLGAVMLVLATLISLASLVYAPPALARSERPFFYPLHQLIMVGVNGSFVTADLFNLFVFFEVMLVASFALLSLGGRGPQLRRAFPYVLINLVSSSLLFVGVGVMYGTAGTVNLAELARRAAAGPLPPAFWAAAALVLSVFGIKAAVLPFFFWLPDAYPASPLPVSALFAGLLTKVGVYTLYRVVPLLAGGDPGALKGVLLAVASATMLVGVLGALGRNSIREILSFHIISQVGYMVFGLAMFTPLSLAAGLFYVVHHIVVKSALFLAGGVAERAGGGRLGEVRGLAVTQPWAAVAFFIPAMALAGIPPFSGFWGKLFLMSAGFRTGAWVATGVAVLVSLLTLASMLKIWSATYWGEPRGERLGMARDRRLVGPPLALAALSVAIGVGAGPLLRFTENAAHQLLDRDPYIEAVLGASTGVAAREAGR